MGRAQLCPFSRSRSRAPVLRGGSLGLIAPILYRGLAFSFSGKAHGGFSDPVEAVETGIPQFGQLFVARKRACIATDIHVQGLPTEYSNTPRSWRKVMKENQLKAANALAKSFQESHPKREGTARWPERIPPSNREAEPPVTRSA